MHKTFLIGLSAIALLLVGGMAFVAWMTRDAPSGVERAADAGADPASHRLHRAEGPPGSEAPAEVSARIASGVGAGPFPVQAKDFQPVRRNRRGAVNGLVAGLGALQPEVARCGNGTRRQPADQAVLLLDLEPQEGAIRVVDARVHSMGKVASATVDCVRQLLVGQLLDVPESRSGKRVSIPYPIAY